MSTLAFADGPTGSALPIIPQSVSRGARISWLHWFAICYGLPGCSPPCTDLTGLPATGGFYFQAFNGSVALPVAGYNYNSDWTPLLAGLSPAGMAASLAARSNCEELALSICRPVYPADMAQRGWHGRRVPGVDSSWGVGILGDQDVAQDGRSAACWIGRQGHRACTHVMR